MKNKFYIGLILFIFSCNLIGQNSDTTYFKDKKFKNLTTKSKAKYMTISKTGPMVSYSNHSINPLELISSYSYKSDDSLNYWRSIELIDGVNRIKTQKDSIFEVVERKVTNDDLIGIVKYKVKLSERDKYAVQQIKNKEVFYDEDKITLPVFNTEIGFLQYITLAATPIRDYRLEITSGEEYVEENMILRIDLDENGLINNLFIIEGIVSEIDMGYYIAAINESKWEKPALENGKPIKFTYYIEFFHREYTPIIVIDKGISY